MSFLIVLSTEKGEAQNLTQVYPKSGKHRKVPFTPVGGGTGTDVTPSVLTNGPTGLPSSPDQTPIDGGLGILAALGGTYAIKKLKDRNK